MVDRTNRNERRGRWPAGGSGCKPGSCWPGSTRSCCACTGSVRPCSTAILVPGPRSPARSASWPNTARSTQFPFLAVGTLLIVGSLFGSLVCGWACPFGFLQDLVARIPTPKLRLPGWLGLTRYAVLVGLVFLVPYYYGEASPWFICRVCPAGALEAAVPYSVQQSIAQHAVVWPSMNKSVILAVFLLSMLFPPPSLVYALLPAGCDLRPVQLRVGGVLAVPTGAVQRLRAMPRPVQVPRAVGTAGERPPLHSLFRVRAVPGPLHQDGISPGERHVAGGPGERRAADHRIVRRVGWTSESDPSH